MATMITVLRVNINCERCKTETFEAVTKLEGIDKVEIDAEKGMVTVVGEVDPVEVVENIRSIGRHVEIESIGPPPKPEEAEKPKPKPEPAKLVPEPIYCHQLVVYEEPGPYYDDRPGDCTIV